MKKKISFWAVFCLLPAMLWAQAYNSNQSNFSFPSDGYGKIVRNWDDHSVVEAYASPSGTRFFLSEFSDFYGPLNPAGITPTLHSYQSLALPNYRVNDMKILDDMVFFCGGKDSNGFVGWFKIREFYPPTMSFNPHLYIFDNPPDDLYELNKLVVFKVDEQYKVVAIGYNNIHPTLPFTLHDNSCILEIDDTMAAPLPFNYYVIDRSLSPYEYIDDVVFTGDKVVFVGRVNYATAYATPSIRVMDNLNSFALSSGFNTLYNFNLNSEMNGRVKAVATSLDDICLAYIHPTPSGDFNTQVRLVSIVSGVPTNFNLQEIANDEKYEIIDMTYLPQISKLVLLYPFICTPTLDPKYLFLSPYNTVPYNAEYTYFTNGVDYMSLDVYGQDNIVSVGENNIYLQYVPTLLNSRCPVMDKTKVYVPDPSPETLILYTPTVVLVNYTLLTPSLSVNRLSWRGVCGN